jgi:hypothetical protein
MCSEILSIMISEAGYRRADVHSQNMVEEDEKEVFITLWT